MLFSKLMERYHVPRGQDAKMIQLRVVNVLKKWYVCLVLNLIFAFHTLGRLPRSFEDFSEELRKYVVKFIERTLVEDGKESLAVSLHSKTRPKPEVSASFRDCPDIMVRILCVYVGVYALLTSLTSILAKFPNPLLFGTLKTKKLRDNCVLCYFTNTHVSNLENYWARRGSTNPNGPLIF